MTSTVLETEAQKPSLSLLGPGSACMDARVPVDTCFHLDSFHYQQTMDSITGIIAPKPPFEKYLPDGKAHVRRMEKNSINESKITAFRTLFIRSIYPIRSIFSDRINI